MSKQGVTSQAHNSFKVRTATKDDLDDITLIHIAGFTEEPEVHYRFPLRAEYPEDHWKWTRREYEAYLEQPEKYVVYVADAAVESDNTVGRKPVGLAIWDIAIQSKAKVTDPGLDERRDANKKHCKVLREVAGKRFDKYFKKWAGKQIYLHVLVVHPDHRRRGAGTMLVNWGIKVADEKHWPVTLCASPIGRFLYEHLNFVQIATEVVQAEGEEETCDSAVMVKEWSAAESVGTFG